MIEKIEILQHRESCNFCCHPCKEALWLLCIVAYHHQVVVQLREHRFYSLSEFLVNPCWWSPVLLVQPVWHFKYDVGRGEQVMLNGSAQIPLVAKYHAVMIFPLHIFQIMEVMHIGGSHIIGVYHAFGTAQGMEFIAIVVHPLRCTISPCGAVSVSILPIAHLFARAF